MCLHPGQNNSKIEVKAQFNVSIHENEQAEKSKTNIMFTYIVIGLFETLLLLKNSNSAKTEQHTCQWTHSLTTLNKIPYFVSNLCGNCSGHVNTVRIPRGHPRAGFIPCGAPS